jgi:basic amino acid/polyamine antiporter, APA family
MNTKDIPLKRSLSFQLLTYYGLGNILGAGIYVLVGKVVGHAGIYAPLSFFIASIVAALTAFTYAEMSSRYPLSAGVAVYLQRGFNISALSLLAGFLIILAGTVSASTIVVGFVGYAQVLLVIPSELLMILIVAILCSIAAWGISESARTAAVFTFLEVFGLLLIIFVASPKLLEISPHIQSLSTTSNLSDFAVLQGVFVGAFLAFYAFIGFEDMVNVAEEVHDPIKTMPKAILLSLLIATILYFIIAILCISIVPPDELAQSNAPLALVYERATGNKPILISLIGVFAVIGGALVQIIMASRILYGLSKQGWLPKFFSRVHPKTHTPILATVIVSLLVLVMALWLPIETLAKATSFLLFIVFAMVNLSLWRIKTHETQHPENIIKLPLWVPVSGAITSIIFVVFQFIIEVN